MNRLAILLAACLLTINSSVVVAQPEDANIELTEADNDLFNALGDEDSDAATAALKAGANIDAISPRGQQTPLMQSVLHGRLSMVKWCLENGADSTIGERDGYTPMHGAGFQGRVEIAEMLHKHGVGLRDKHPGDGHEPISEYTCYYLLCLRVYLSVCVCAFPPHVLLERARCTYRLIRRKLKETLKETYFNHCLGPCLLFY